MLVFFIKNQCNRHFVIEQRKSLIEKKKLFPQGSKFFSDAID